MSHKLSRGQIDVVLSRVKQHHGCASEEATFVRVHRAHGMPDGAEGARLDYRQFLALQRTKLPPYITAEYQEYFGMIVVVT